MLVCSEQTSAKFTGLSLLQAIDAVRVEEDHQVIDLYVLFVLYTVWTRRKNVRQLLLSKVKAGLFTNRLVDALFNCKIPVSM